MQKSASNAWGSGPDLHAEGSVLATAPASLPSIDSNDSYSLHSGAVLLHDIDWWSDMISLSQARSMHLD
jgi:hypothetical protein